MANIKGPPTPPPPMRAAPKNTNSAPSPENASRSESIHSMPQSRGASHAEQKAAVMMVEATPTHIGADTRSGV